MVHDLAAQLFYSFHSKCFVTWLLRSREWFLIYAVFWPSVWYNTMPSCKLCSAYIPSVIIIDFSVFYCRFFFFCMFLWIIQFSILRLQVSTYVCEFMLPKQLTTINKYKNKNKNVCWASHGYSGLAHAQQQTRTPLALVVGESCH